MKSKTAFYALSGTIVLAVVAVWLVGSPRASRSQFETAIIQDFDRVPPLSIAGSLYAVGSVPMFASSDGVVTQILVAPGQEVREGQILAALDVTDAEMQHYFSLKKSMGRLGTSDLDRKLQSIERLVKSGFYSSGEAETARAEALRTADEFTRFFQAFDQIKKRTDGKVLRAPFAGKVNQISWNMGDMIAANRQMNPGVTIEPAER